MRASFAAALALVLADAPAYACSVCFGDPSSKLSRGVVAGVTVLLAVVVCVLAAIAWTAVSWSRRARSLARASEAA